MMPNYVMTCARGTEVLVSAESAEDAEAAWDRDVRAGNAEERADGTTRRASREDVRRCVAAGHDYR